MPEIPKRDITGECEGECRDRVNEGQKERQEEMEQESTKAPESYPNAPGAEKRKEQPGSMGGHV